MSKLDVRLQLSIGLGVIILSNTQVEAPYQPEFIVRTVLSDLWDTGRMTTPFQKLELAETPELWPFLQGYYGKRPRTSGLHFWTGLVSGGLAGASLLLGLIVWRKLQRLARGSRK